MREHIHSETSFRAFQQTLQTYPRAWYEHKFFSSKILMLAIILPSFWLLIWLQVIPNTALSIVGVAVYFGGLTIDVITTARIANFKPEFDKLDMEFPLYESAATFPPVPTLKDILTHWHFWLMIAAAPVIYLVPTGAFGILVARLSVSLNNLRQVKRLKLALKTLAKPASSQPEQGLWR